MLANEQMLLTLLIWELIAHRWLRQDTDDVIYWLHSQPDAQHLAFSSQAFVPAYLFCSILLEEFSFSKVSAFTCVRQ